MSSGLFIFALCCLIWYGIRMLNLLYPISLILYFTNGRLWQPLITAEHTFFIPFSLLDTFQLSIFYFILIQVHFSFCPETQRVNLFPTRSIMPHPYFAHTLHCSEFLYISSCNIFPDGRDSIQMPYNSTVGFEWAIIWFDCKVCFQMNTAYHPSDSQGQGNHVEQISE